MRVAWLALLLLGTSGAWGASIPAHLLQCYRDGGALLRASGLPRTMYSLLQLLQRVERYPGPALDLRTMAFTLLHKFRLDGVEREPTLVETPSVTPVRLTGRQYPRWRVLKELLIPGSDDFYPDGSLTEAQMCALHDMLSSRVDPWARGDEARVCPQQPAREDHQLSACPLEGGAVRAGPWGAVAPGAVLAALAAALQPQQVFVGRLLEAAAERFGAAPDAARRDAFRRVQELPESETVTNVCAATLSGDLAEVALLQAPRSTAPLVLGPGGVWNDSALPRSRTLLPRAQGALWDLTDAELAGGVDGLTLASRITGWNRRAARLRLSQLLDMYYSARGVAFDGAYRACQRRSRLLVLLDYERLFKETLNLVRVLYQHMPDVATITDLEPPSQRALDAFRDYYESVVKDEACEQPVAPRVRLHVAIDHTWTGYAAEELIASLSEAIHVSHFGSALALVDGYSGQALFSRTDDFPALMETVHTTPPAPGGALRAGPALAGALRDLNERASTALDAGEVGSPGTAVLLVACGARLGDTEARDALPVLASLRRMHPDVHVLVAATAAAEAGYASLLEAAPGPGGVVRVAEPCEAEGVTAAATEALTKVPGRLQGVQCVSPHDEESSGYELLEYALPGEFEDYVTPGQPQWYRVDPQYLQGSNSVSVKVRGSGQGSLSVCWTRVDGLQAAATSFSSASCVEVQGNEEVRVNATSPCAGLDPCPPLLLRLNVTETLFKCTEDDCRYPDQVRFSLLPDGLRCFYGPGEAGFGPRAAAPIGPFALALAAALLAATNLARTH